VKTGIWRASHYWWEPHWHIFPWVSKSVFNIGTLRLFSSDLWTLSNAKSKFIIGGVKISCQMFGPSRFWMLLSHARQLPNPELDGIGSFPANVPIPMEMEVRHGEAVKRRPRRFSRLQLFHKRWSTPYLIQPSPILIPAIARPCLMKCFFVSNPNCAKPTYDFTVITRPRPPDSPRYPP